MTAQYVEGIINEYNEDIIHGGIGKGGGRPHLYESYYIVIDNIKIYLSAYEKEKFKGRKFYWKKNSRVSMPKYVI